LPGLAFASSLDELADRKGGFSRVEATVWAAAEDIFDLGIQCRIRFQ
jgi:hypothetical protein